MIGAAIKKDIWLLLRDRGALISLFALPIVFILAFGSMFNTNTKGQPDDRRPIAIAYPANDARGAAIERAIGKTQGFSAQHVATPEAARALVVSEAVTAAVIVPADFDPATGHRIELSIDLAGPPQAIGPLQGAIGGAIMRAFAPVDVDALPPVYEAMTPPGLAKPIEDISSFQITVPGNAVLFGFFIALTTAMSFVGERRTGTWRRLLAAPVSRYQALLATLVPYYVVGLTQLAFLFGLGALVFGMHISGSVVALVVLSMSVSLCAVSLGLMFAAIATTEKQLGGVGSVVLLVMGLLGGCMFPRLLMPPGMKTIGLATPHAWALDAYHAVLVRQGTTLVDILPSIGALVGFSVLFATIGLVRFRFES